VQEQQEKPPGASPGPDETLRLWCLPSIALPLVVIFLIQRHILNFPRAELVESREESQGAGCGAGKDGEGKAAPRPRSAAGDAEALGAALQSQQKAWKSQVVGRLKHCKGK